MSDVNSAILNAIDTISLVVQVKIRSMLQTTFYNNNLHQVRKHLSEESEKMVNSVSNHNKHMHLFVAYMY